MSSILKSLKKLEIESELGLLPSERPAFNSRQTLRRQINSHRRNRLRFFSLIAVCALVAGGWYLWPSGPVAPPSLPTSPSPSAVLKPEKRVREAVTAERTHIPDAAALQNQAKSDSPPSRRMKVESSAPGPAAPEKVPAPPALSPEKPAPALAKPPAAAADAPELAPLPADAGLKLEALAWASAMESRFVVINSQIVREGEMIGGVKVERIETEQVVLRKDGRLWQLRHRPQR